MSNIFLKKNPPICVNLFLSTIAFIYEYMQIVSSFHAFYFDFRMKQLSLQQYRVKSNVTPTGVKVSLKILVSYRRLHRS